MTGQSGDGSLPGMMSSSGALIALAISLKYAKRSCAHGPEPLHEPDMPAPPRELPGETPSEVPARGPQGPTTPNPATD